MIGALFVVDMGDLYVGSSMSRQNSSGAGISSLLSRRRIPVFEMGKTAHQLVYIWYSGGLAAAT